VADCTGTMLAAKTGILKGRNANTLHVAVDALRKYDVNVIPARVVDDGNLIISGGITSGIDLALWIIERFLGKEISHEPDRFSTWSQHHSPPG
jgi:transcriptional regulator GlxA family with amidase domain